MESACHTFGPASLLGVLHIQQKLSNITEAERVLVVRRCLEFTTSRNYSNLNHSRRGGSYIRYRGGDWLSEELEPVSNDDFVAGYWRGASEGHNGPSDRKHVTVTVTDAEVTTTVDGDSQPLCTHLVGWMAIVNWLGPAGELVYIGHEVSSRLRMAVVLRLASKEDALRIISVYSHMKQSLHENIHVSSPPSSSCSTRSRHKSSSAPSEVSHSSSVSSWTQVFELDPFYENMGLVVHDQERLYESAASSEASKMSKKNNHDELERELNIDLRNFVKNEANYCNNLYSLIKTKIHGSEGDLQYILQYWNKIYRSHEVINLERFAHSRDLKAAAIAEVLIAHNNDLKCYIDYIRETPRLDKITRKYFSNNRSALETVTLSRKRIHFYFMSLETWVQLVSSSSEEQILIDAITVLRNIYKSADTLLTIDAVKTSPYCLNLYLPLMKHSTFSVDGRNFEKSRPYKVLLFNDLLVFTISSTEYLDCFEVFRLEKITMLNRTKSERSRPSIKLSVFHGTRRGHEVILMFGKSPRVVQEWEAEISWILSKFMHKIKATYSVSNV